MSSLDVQMPHAKSGNWFRSGETTGASGDTRSQMRRFKLSTMDKVGNRLNKLQAHLGSESELLVAPNNTSAVAVEATPGSIWNGVPQAPPDPILGVSEAFKADKDGSKMNLGVGAYRTEEGKPLVLNSVRAAERQMVADMSLNKEYLGIGGNPNFCKLSRELILGADCAAVREGRVSTVQSLSGTGALRIAAEFLGTFYKGAAVYLPNPTWGNHKKIFPNGGVAVKSYRYYNPATRGLDFQGLCEDLCAAPAGSIILLHACAHNPTGVDPTHEQWAEILKVVKAKQLLPLFDSAYQGFASGDLDRDAQAVRMFVNAGLEVIICQSYAKNMGLYGERIGALSFVVADAGVAKKVYSQMQQVIRPMYSNPPMHGAAIVERILSNKENYEAWKLEVKGMADRIISMRTALHSALQKLGTPGNWDHILNQIGMFTFTGLNSAQVTNMTKKHHVYMTQDGRISMAGVTAAKAQYLAAAIDDSVRNC
ncbi:hypothetical protein CYMTET_28091 [Cymbomonas tetramitiformis]|uniref:Aspartate aminotransferase n=1 Tax=Cymbomonas tetramitiformis TaxID=36881 RepID=A0AAE0FP33_9CHLO|nr:hypothetical protein CYMTET_28091 [Cymbomonas tetramitiformis]